MFFSEVHKMLPDCHAAAIGFVLLYVVHTSLPLYKMDDLLHVYQIQQLQISILRWRIRRCVAALDALQRRQDREKTRVELKVDRTVDDTLWSLLSQEGSLQFKTTHMLRAKSGRRVTFLQRRGETGAPTLNTSTSQDSFFYPLWSQTNNATTHFSSRPATPLHHPVVGSDLRGVTVNNPKNLEL